MTRSFRFAPPQPRDDLVVRPRLLRSLAERWRHRVTSLTGGPGLGKTTLLAQAIAENHLAPRGEDLWVGLSPQDDDADSLARAVASAVERRTGNGNGDAAVPPPAMEPDAVAEAVWHRAPIEECLVLDDVHLLSRGSSGAEWLEALLAALPANGHVVLSCRSEPPVRLGRYGTHGEVLWLAEDDLRFDDDELSGFARQRGVDPRWLDVTGGWPAMAELVAVAPASTSDRQLTGTYLWEEVLEPLGAVRRHLLAVLSDLGGADDELMSAAVDTAVDLTRVLEGVPLVARSAAGWFVAHGLWRDAPGLALDPAERVGVRRRAVDNLLARGRFDDAFGLVEEAGLWDTAPRVLRAACLAPDRLSSGQLGRWMTRSPESVKETVAGRLAAGIHAWFHDPEHAAAPLRRAADAAREAGDVEAEVTAIAQLGFEAWWRQDLMALAHVGLRVAELEATGNPRAHGLAIIGRAVLSDMTGDTGRAGSELLGLDPDELDPAWQVLSLWLSGVTLLHRGDLDGVGELVERFRPQADPTQAYVLTTLEGLVSWFEGEVDEAIAAIPEAVRLARRTGANAYLYIGLAMAAMGYAQVGEVAKARRCFEDARAIAPPTPDGQPTGSLLLAEAALLLAEGRPDEATERVRQTIDRSGLDRGIDRHVWRLHIALSYVVVPETRAYWDGLTLVSWAAKARELARVVVALREGRRDPRLHSVAVPPVGVVRTMLPSAFVAELAVGLSEVGRPESRALLAAAGTPAREVVRAVAAGTYRAWSDQVPAASVRTARALLAAVPAPPPQQTYVAVLGPMVLRRGGPDGEEILDPELRRRRVQELLAYLVGHRRTTRGAIMAALWPDLDERSAGNNLGVTVNHLLRVLEPWRDPGEPSYLLRMDGQVVHMVTDEHLRFDVDDFDVHVAAAARAEQDGTPSLALEHDLAAVALYRDTLHFDVVDAGWLDLDREHYQTRFVAAAVRAGQLLLARGEIDKAQTVVYRALTTDPWSEDGYAVLVGAALARRDRGAARRVLDRCRVALAELGVEPSESLKQLRRRVELG